MDAVFSENSEVTTDSKTFSTETDGSISPGSRHTATAVKENAPSQPHKPPVIFIGHSEHEWPELLPEFVGVDYNPEIVSASPLQRGNDDSVFPDSLKEEEDDSYWPELSALEFASVGYYGMLPRKTSGEDPDNTDNANFPESHENPATKDTDLTEEIPSKTQNRHHRLDNTDKCTEDVSYANNSVVTKIPYNGTLNDEDLVCADQRMGIGYWKLKDDNDICVKDDENLHLCMAPLIFPTRDDTPLQVTSVKKAKNKRMAEALIDENVFCLAGKNQSGPVSVIMCLDLFTLLIFENRIELNKLLKMNWSARKESYFIIPFRENVGKCEE